MLHIGLVGKPNCGKSTFFSAATLVEVPIADYPFTTIDANIGVTYFRTKCPCQELGVKCNPQNSKCIQGMRLVPVQVLDVAGLVPGASEGKGLGNKFLDDLRQASALVHVIDLSGSTDSEGKGIGQNTHDPAEDISFLEKEIDSWLAGIIKGQWEKFARKVQFQREDLYKFAGEALSGLGFTEEHIRSAVSELGLDKDKPLAWTDKELEGFASALRQQGKPMIIAANKADKENALENLEKLKERFPSLEIIACSAESELALRKAEKAGLVEYTPGEGDFRVVKEATEKQRRALEFIRKDVLEKIGSTGVQKVLDTAIGRLELITVYPVEDENKYTDKKGNILPDAKLVKKGTTPVGLAYQIHTDIGERFIAAVDARTKKKMGKEHELEDGQIVKIVTRN